MTDSNRRQTRRSRDGAQAPASRRGSDARPSTSPTGTPRSGRRQTARQRHDQQSPLDRFRTPLIALAVVAVVVGVSVFVFASATAATYACSTTDTVQPAASGELGQVQADMGNAHVQTGDKITYPVCPPASGKHVNRQGFGPLKPKVYGPDDQSTPNGWVHNLEHGGLVVLYSCDKGACDSALTQQLESLSQGFPTSPVCKLQAGIVGPVAARFEQMPTRFAALVWDRALYLDTLDTTRIYDFFTKYSERLSAEGTWITPPEPQCAAPSPSPSAAPSPSASAGPSGSPAASASPAATASPASSAARSPAPSTEPSPSAS